MYTRKYLVTIKEASDGGKGNGGKGRKGKDTDVFLFWIPQTHGNIRTAFCDLPSTSTHVAKGRISN